MPEAGFQSVARGCTLQDFGVFFRVSKAGERHVGLLAGFADGAVKIIHVVRRVALQTGAPSRDDYWSDAGLHPVRRRIVAIAVRKSIERLREGSVSVPYSPIFDPEFGCANLMLDQETGAVSYDNDSYGFTRATFVLAYLAALGVEVLDQAHWLSRAEDAAWQGEIATMLARDAPPGSVNEALAARVRASVDGGRFRPEEVAVGVAAHNIPLSFEQAEASGRRLLALALTP